MMFFKNRKRKRNRKRKIRQKNISENIANFAQQDAFVLAVQIAENASRKKIFSGHFESKYQNSQESRLAFEKILL